MLWGAAPAHPLPRLPAILPRTPPRPDAGPVVPEAAAAALEGAAFGIWTTTPWTIPANLAVAVNGELAYAVVEIEVGGRQNGRGRGGRGAGSVGWMHRGWTVGVPAVEIEDRARHWQGCGRVQGQVARFQ